MNRDKRCHLKIGPDEESSRYQHITALEAGWEFLHFEARMMRQSEKMEGYAGEHEVLFVLLGGNFKAETSLGSWETMGGRKDVFSGLPHALYLPPGTTYQIEATSEVLDIACGWCPATEIFPANFITPDQVQNMGIELRGGDNASRQINSILPPGSACQRLVCVEVYTPSGNWSSFPSHKHDNRSIDTITGKVNEASLQEIYFYKINKPQGFAIQRVYTDDRSLDEIAVLQTNDAMLVPRGYHPVVSGHGYHTYYLNFLAGSDQSLANTDDPDHKWIYGTWKGMDERLPLVTRYMNKK